MNTSWPPQWLACTCIPDPLRLAGMVIVMKANMEARKVESSGIDMHEQGGALQIVGTALALAKGTACVEPTSEAERARAAKSKVLVPWVQGMAWCKVERLPQECAQDTVERGQG